MFGNLDKDKQHPFPKSWLDKDNVVIVKQERYIDPYGNGELHAIPHPQPVQAIPKKIYDENSIVPVGAKKTGFEDQGLKVTPLHDTSKPDEDIQFETNVPAANVALTEQDETIKKAVEAVKSGEDAPAAEVFKEKSDELAAQTAGSIPAVEEKTEAKKEDKPKSGK
jgi:hypothetical protein